MAALSAGRGFLRPRDWPVRTKIYSLVAFVLAAAISVGALGLATASEINSRTDAMYDKNLVPSQELDRVRADMKDLRIGILNTVVAGVATNATPAAIQAQIKKIDEA